MEAGISASASQLGKSITIRGELSGAEDMYLDGQLEGSIQLRGKSLTIGPNGRIRANISAGSVTVSGSVDGNLEASERADLRKTAVVNGDIQTRRIAIEDGAYFKGKLEILAEGKSQGGDPGMLASAASSASRSPETGK
jgi:cytoskeletal protein CcmA (bactofilin family)